MPSATRRRGSQSAPLNAAGLPQTRYTLQVYVEDCTGCGLCVEACPVKPVDQPSRRAINLVPLLDREKEKEAVEYFETIPQNDRSRVDFGTIRGTQFLEPLFEFSGACSGCGETPVPQAAQPAVRRPRHHRQRHRLLVDLRRQPADARRGPRTPRAAGRPGPTPCSRTTPSSAWASAWPRTCTRTSPARGWPSCATRSATTLWSTESSGAPQRQGSELTAQLDRVNRLKEKLVGLKGIAAEDLRSVADHLMRRSVWIVGGDGWAYDIGSGGVDHVLASGRNVNILVLDTEVYSNTGGQASKSTPLGAVAKFASGGKLTNKKDLAMQAMAYGSVYVARVAMGADPQQTLKAFREAEAYDGPSLIIAYSHCIAHGYDIRKGLEQQYRAVNSGHWPLMRYNPVIRDAGGNPFLLDSPRPRMSLQKYQSAELRYKVLRAADPVEADRLLALAQEQVDRRWSEYEELAGRGAHQFAADPRNR